MALKIRCTFALLTLSGLLVAASTASATTLCESAPGPSICPAGERYPIPQKIQAVLAAKTSFKLAEGGVTVECNESKIAAETFKNLGIGLALKATVGVWSLANGGGNCVVGGTACTVSEWKSIPAETGLFSAGGNGTMSFSTPMEIETECSKTKCLYATGLTLEFKGGIPGVAGLNANGLELSRATGSNVFCAAKATLNADYTITEPTKAVWITEAP